MFFNTYDQCLAVLKFTACTSQSKRWRTQKKFRPRTKTGNFQIKEIQRSIECMKGFSALFEINGASLATQTAHAPLAVQETQVQSLGREDPLEKGMVAHSSVLAVFLQFRRPRFNPWGGKIPWRREWLPTPAFLPGEPHGQRSLVGYSPWGRKESGTTEATFFFHWIHERMLTSIQK